MRRRVVGWACDVGRFLFLRHGYLVSAFRSDFVKLKRQNFDCRRQLDD